MGENHSSQDQVAIGAPARKGMPAEPIRLPAWALRAGRAAAGLSAEQMARASRLAVNTIRRAEKDGLDRMSANNLKALHDAFAAVGVVFSTDRDGGVVVGLAPSRTTGNL